MSWIRLVTAGLEALAAYLQRKAQSVLYDEIAKAERTLDDLQKKIDSLRDSGSDADAVFADWLRPRVKRQQAYLSALYADADRRASNPDN